MWTISLGPAKLMSYGYDNRDESWKSMNTARKLRLDLKVEVFGLFGCDIKTQSVDMGREHQNKRRLSLQACLILSCVLRKATDCLSLFIDLQFRRTEIWDALILKLPLP